jgi:WD40 repeat protein
MFNKERRLFLSVGISEPGEPFEMLKRVPADIEAMKDIFLEKLKYEHIGIELNSTTAALQEHIRTTIATADLKHDQYSVVIYFSGHAMISGETLYLVMRETQQERPGSTGFSVLDLVTPFTNQTDRPAKMWLMLDCCSAGRGLSEAVFRPAERQGISVFGMAACADDSVAFDGQFARAFSQAFEARGRSLGFERFAADLQARLGARDFWHKLSLSGSREFDLLKRSGSRPTNDTPAQTNQRGKTASRFAASQNDNRFLNPILPPKRAGLPITTGKWADYATHSIPLTMYGSKERAEIDTWANRLLQKELTCVALSGMRGSGKSTKALALWRRLYLDNDRSPFEIAAWISFAEGKEAMTVGSIVRKFNEGLRTGRPDNVDDLIVELSKQQRVLIVLDNVESVMSGASAGELGSNLAQYDVFIDKLLLCPSIAIVLTSVEALHVVEARRKTMPGIAVKTVDGVSMAAARKIVRSILRERDHDLSKHVRATVKASSQADWDAVIDHVGSNPLMLQTTVTAILDDDQTPGNPEKCLRSHRISKDIADLLQWHWARMRPPEKEVMLWLAINRAPMSVEDLQSDLMSPKSKVEVHQTLAALRRRLPLKRYESTTVRFSLHGSILDFSRGRVVDETLNQLRRTQSQYSTSRTTASSLRELIVAGSVRDVEKIEGIRRKNRVDEFRRIVRKALEQDGSTSFVLVDHALLKVNATASLQRLQRAEILRPILQQLGQNGDQIGKRLRRMLPLTRDLPGYLAGNLLNLLRELGEGAIDVRVSAASAELRQVDFRGLRVGKRINLRDARLSRAALTQPLGQPRAVRISPDGNFIAVGDNNGAVTTWRLSDMSTVVRRHTRHGKMIRALAFSGDGRILASTGGEDNAVFVWDTWSDQEGEPWSLFDGPGLGSPHKVGTLRDLAFNVHGQLATASEDGTVWVHDIKAKQSKNWLRLPGVKIHAIAFHPRRNAMVAGTSDGRINWIELVGDMLGVRTLRSEAEHAGALWSLAFDGSGERFASGGADGFVRLWRTSDLRMVWQQKYGVDPKKPHEVFAVAFTTDGDAVISGGEDRTVYLSNASDGALRKNLVQTADEEGHEDRIRSIAATEDDRGPIFVSGGFDRKLIVWRPDGERVASVIGYGNGVTGLAFGRSGEMLGAYEDRCVRRWRENLAGRYEEEIVHRHDGPALCVAWREVDGAIFSGGRDGSILKSVDQQRRVLVGRHDHWVASVDLDSTGELLASGGEDARVLIWNLETGSHVSCDLGDRASQPAWRERAHEDRVRVVRFSPDPQSPFLVSGGYDRAVRVWDAKTGVLRTELTNTTNWVVGLDVSREGLLACAWGGPEIRLFDLRELEQKGTLRCLSSWRASKEGGHRIFGVRFLPDGRLVTAGEDGLVHIWTARENDWEKPEESIFHQHKQGSGHSKIVGLAVSEDGRIASGDSAGRGFVWRPGIEEPEKHSFRPRLPYEGLDLQGATRLAATVDRRDVPLDEGQRVALRELGAKA